MKNKEEFNSWLNNYLKIHIFDPNNMDEYISQMIRAAWNKGYQIGVDDCYKSQSVTYVNTDSITYTPSREV